MTGHHTTPTVATTCAVALALSLSLAGCGKANSTSTSQDAQETQQAEAEAQEQEGVIGLPAEMTGAANIVRTVAQSGDTSGAGDFASLPTSEDAALTSIEGTGELVEGDADASKAPSGRTMLTGLGIQLCIPNTWQAGYLQDGSIGFLNPEQTVIGVLYGGEKPSGSHYDLEGMARALPTKVAAQGYTDIEVIGFDTGYSDRGTLCSSYVCFAATIDGIEHVHFVQFVESLTYLNVIEIYGTASDFAANVSDINAIVSSVQFIPSELI